MASQDELIELVVRYTPSTIEYNWKEQSAENRENLKGVELGYVSICRRGENPLPFCDGWAMRSAFIGFDPLSQDR